MRKTYTVIMREGGEIVAERKYTNKKSAVDMGIWYLTQRLAYNGRDAKFIKEKVKEFRKTWNCFWICKIVES